MKRESTTGRPSGRTHEIQRLISRSLRAITDLQSLGERQIIIDCDVLQADGGTRTASITGGFVALYEACKSLMRQGSLSRMPLMGEVAAISCGIVNDVCLLDLDYSEDSEAEVDANFIITSSGSLVEVQATAEENPFSTKQLLQMLNLAEKGVGELIEAQRAALGIVKEAWV
jgi:ribonuclease PH